MSDNPTGGDTIFCLPVAPSATISEVCWARTFVTAFVVPTPRWNPPSIKVRLVATSLLGDHYTQRS